METLMHMGYHVDHLSPAIVLGGMILGAILLRAVWLSIWRGF